MSLELYRNTKVVFLDLDDTIYPEKDYLFTAYQAIADYLAAGDSLLADQFMRFLQDGFEARGRAGLFDALFQEFSLDSSNMNEVLGVLRSVKMGAKLHPDKELLSFLQTYCGHCSWCIVTNGNPQQQQNKVEQIDWTAWKIEEVIYANTIAPKPSPASLLDYFDRHPGISRGQALFIGDSTVDQACAEAAGVRFLHIQEVKNRYRDEEV